MLRSILGAIFVGDVNWAWRRRVAVSTTAVLLAGILNSIFWDHDLAHSTMVMNSCVEGLWLVFTIYVGAAVIDDHMKRRVEAIGGATNDGAKTS